MHPAISATARTAANPYPKLPAMVPHRQRAWAFAYWYASVTIAVRNAAASGNHPSRALHLVHANRKKLKNSYQENLKHLNQKSQENAKNANLKKLSQHRIRRSTDIKFYQQTQIIK